MTRDDRIRDVQRLYPLLYFAAHDSHRRSDGLSESALRLLHHIAATPGVIAAELSRHLGLSPSRLSEALAALERQSLVQRTPGAGGRSRRARASTRASWGRSSIS
ncbi:MAG: helix-turn-helix domain-containing protein [Longimicrobiales bacterium]